MQTAGIFAYGLMWGWLLVLRCGRARLRLYSYLIAAFILIGNAFLLAGLLGDIAGFHFVASATVAMFLPIAWRQERLRNLKPAEACSEPRS